jgi:hypothetical protein
MVHGSTPVACRRLNSMPANLVIHHIAAIRAPPGTEPQLTASFQINEAIHDHEAIAPFAPHM